MTGAEISVGGGYTAVSTSQRQDSTFALIPKRCSASSFHHRRRGKSSRHTAKPTVGSRRSRPYQRLRPVNEEGSRPRSGRTEFDSRLISRTVIPYPRRDHVGEFQDHCAFDGVPLELVQGTVDGERLQGMALRCQRGPWSVLSKRCGVGSLFPDHHKIDRHSGHFLTMKESFTQRRSACLGS